MAWGSGVFTRQGAVHSGSSLWASSATDGNAVISSSEHDTHDQDLADGISACLHAGGQNAVTADIAWGSNNITGLAAGTATGHNGRWDEDVASASLNGTVLEINFNDGTSTTVDLASVGAAAGMDLTTAQTVTGVKTFSVAAVLALLKMSGPVYAKVQQLTGAASVAVDTTSYSSWYLSNDQAMTLTFTWPAASADTQLGANFKVKGEIQFRNASGHGAITLAHATSVTDEETIGSRPTGSTEMYTLHYQCTVIGGSRYVQFTWVSA